jgi:glycosyltransferase involved in cell wall biosynthesis
MYKGRRVSLVLPTYNEKDSIRKVIQDFEELRVVDEILVINNNAAEGTSEEVRHTSDLSDVGCTYRLIRREALVEMLPTFRVRSNFFGPEMMVRGYRMGLRCLQIPVNYKDRVGKSSVTGDLKKAIGLGIRMVILIIAMRFSLERWLLKILK